MYELERMQVYNCRISCVAPKLKMAVTYRTRFLINSLQSLECAYPGMVGNRFALKSQIHSSRTTRRRGTGGSGSQSIRRDVYICYTHFSTCPTKQD